MNWEPVIKKLMSGRYIMTLVASGVFAYCSCFGILPVDKINEALLIIIFAYFNKKDENK